MPRFTDRTQKIGFIFNVSEVRNILFNDLNTFYVWLYGVGHMVKDHSDSERGNPLLPLHGLLFSISSRCSFICTIPQTTAFVIPVKEYWLV